MAFGVLIVDDSRLFLEAARDLLERKGLRVVGVTATSAGALRQAEELRLRLSWWTSCSEVRAGLSWPGAWPHTIGMAGRP
jgi:CheY-like chemotaxis protein